jgi:hypothetical protein
MNDANEEKNRSSPALMDYESPPPRDPSMIIERRLIFWLTIGSVIGFVFFGIGVNKSSGPAFSRYFMLWSVVSIGALLMAIGCAMSAASLFSELKRSRSASRRRKLN